METANTKTITWLTAGLVAGLLFMGALRFSAAHPTFLAAIAVLRVIAMSVSPLLEELFGGGRDLQRFADVEGSLPT